MWSLRGEEGWRGGCRSPLGPVLEGGLSGPVGIQLYIPGSWSLGQAGLGLPLCARVEEAHPQPTSAPIPVHNPRCARRVDPAGGGPSAVPSCAQASAGPAPYPGPAGPLLPSSQASSPSACPGLLKGTHPSPPEVSKLSLPPSHRDRALSPDQVTAGPEGLPCSRAPPGSHEGSQEPW